MFTSQIIEAKYRELGLEDGWTFLACPEARLRDAQIAIVGTNPGGGGPWDDYPYRGIWACDHNSFYRDPSRHRSQVQEWHRLLRVGENETLCAQFIPFRSPDLGSLNKRREAIAFARELWAWVLEVSPATLFITMGRVPAIQLVDLLGAKQIAQDLPTGWERQTIDVWESDGGRRVVRMPHPSIFRLFGRGDPSHSAIAEAMFCHAVEGG